MNETDKTPPGTAGPAAVPELAAQARKSDPVFLVLAIVLSLAGMAGFIVLFINDFNVYWLILSPVILALYQIPAVFVFWLLKRRRLARQSPPSAPRGPSEDGNP